MAPGRLYRDYSNPDNESFNLDIDHRQHYPVQNGRELHSPQTVIFDDEPHAEDDRTRYFGAGTAHTTDTATMSSGADNEVFSEPVLDSQQINDPQFFAGAAPAPAIPWHARATSPTNTSVFPYPQPPASVASNDLPSPSLHSTSSKKLPEFFSQSTFQTVLNNPTISHQFLKFAQSRLCGENLEFLAKVTRYRGLLDEVSKSVYEIHKEFISASSASQINLPELEHRKVNSEMKTALGSTLPSLENIFLDAQSHIEDLVYRDVYRKFVQYQMSLSAAKALGKDKSKYAGLGDCFVLTDPSKADNPIVFASDGFVKVTGYSRSEIIPRNCRFLQSRETDKQAVKRLKLSLDKREESVELLLNRKKNGEPFWNLLYTTPLFDEYGKLLFFLGGQVNCSTTIHSASDVLRILAQSNEPEEDDQAFVRTPSPQAVKPKRSFMKSLPFRLGGRNSVQARAAPGMEDSLLSTMGDKPLKDQMSSFYTAYSNYIIVNSTSYLIAFLSTGITDLLFPIKARQGPNFPPSSPRLNINTSTSSSPPSPTNPAIGTDIFRFLANHAPTSSSLSSDFKASVKNALKTGSPISLEAKLCARPYMGFERFVLHWTPLKDERGEVVWCVLTLGSEERVGVAY